MVLEEVAEFFSSGYDVDSKDGPQNESHYSHQGLVDCEMPFQHNHHVNKCVRQDTVLDKEMGPADVSGVIMIVLLTLPTEFMVALSTGHMKAPTILINGNNAARTLFGQH